MAGKASREFDIVIYSVTAFTGKYVAKYYKEHYHGKSELKVAVAARDEKKARAIMAELGLDLPLIIANSNDSASLRAMCVRTKTIINLVGPYLKYATSLVEIATSEDVGTNLVDLTGESQFMRLMTDMYSKDAESSGAKIVSACGFDSIPSDLNAFLSQEAFYEKYEENPARIVNYLTALKGGFSGGTIATALNLLKDKSWAELRQSALRLKSPYYLVDREPLCKTDTKNILESTAYDAHVDSYVSTWLMAPVNAQVVRRSLVARQDTYKSVPSYLEVTTLYGKGLKGFLLGHLMTILVSVFFMTLIFKPTCYLMERFVLPVSGDGPSEEVMDNGMGIMMATAFSSDGSKMTTSTVTMAKDPGYGATVVMIFEAAIILSQNPLGLSGGFYTPSNAMRHHLVDRLTHTNVFSFKTTHSTK